MILKKQLNIKTTGVCNANCSFCGYNRDQLKKWVSEGKTLYTPGLEKIHDSLDLLKEKGIGVLHFTGGEPTMEKGLIPLIKKAKAKGFQIRTGTNGSLLNEDKIKSLIDSGLDYLWFSIDTFPFDKHCIHRGLQSYQKNMEKSLALLIQNKVNVFGQTVISRIIPSHQGIPDLRSHLKYYRENFDLKRFIFSYPMQRELGDSLEGQHLATAGSYSVSYTKAELLEIFRSILMLKKSEKQSVILNPYLSLLQQIDELQGIQNSSGCYAGKSIFFLGEDQSTLRPCYFYASEVVDQVNSQKLKSTDKYIDCSSCRDQCFRDPSIIYSIQDKPGQFLWHMLKNPQKIKYGFLDLFHVAKTRGYKVAA